MQHPSPTVRDVADPYQRSRARQSVHHHHPFLRHPDPNSLLTEILCLPSNCHVFMVLRMFPCHVSIIIISRRPARRSKEWVPILPRAAQALCTIKLRHRKKIYSILHDLTKPAGNMASFVLSLIHPETVTQQIRQPIPNESKDVDSPRCGFRTRTKSPSILVAGLIRFIQWQTRRKDRKRHDEAWHARVGHGLAWFGMVWQWSGHGILSCLSRCCMVGLVSKPPAWSGRLSPQTIRPGIQLPRSTTNLVCLAHAFHQSASLTRHCCQRSISHPSSIVPSV